MRTLVVVLVLGLIAGVARADPPHAHTDRGGTRLLPLSKAEDVFHLVVFGDRTGGPAAGLQVLEQAVRDTNLLDPDLVMTVGDLVQGYNEAPARGKRRRNGMPHLIGADPDASGRPMRIFGGFLDEVRISRGVRYEGEGLEPRLRHEPDDDTLLLRHLDRGLDPFVLDHGPGRRHALGRRGLAFVARAKPQ